MGTDVIQWHGVPPASKK